LGLLTAAAVAVLSADYFRRTGRSDATAGLTLGVCLASIGLALDAILLLATRFRYPNVEAHRTPTLASCSCSATALPRSWRCWSRGGGYNDEVRLLALPLVALAFHASIQPLSPSLRARLTGPFWRSGCPVSLAQLRVLSVTHFGFDGRAHQGQL